MDAIGFQVNGTAYKLTQSGIAQKGLISEKLKDRENIERHLKLMTEIGLIVPEKQDCPRFTWTEKAQRKLNITIIPGSETPHYNESYMKELCAKGLVKDSLDVYRYSASRWEEAYEDYLHSETWARIRDQRLKIDGYRCRHCGCNDREHIRVHHINYPAVWGTEDVWLDLITLCKNCHANVHKGTIMKYDLHNLSNVARGTSGYSIQQNRFGYLFIVEYMKMDVTNTSIAKPKRVNICNMDFIKQKTPEIFEKYKLLLGEQFSCVVQSTQNNFILPKRADILREYLERGFTKADWIRETGMKADRVEKLLARYPKNEWEKYFF